MKKKINFIFLVAFFYFLKNNSFDKANLTHISIPIISVILSNKINNNNIKNLLYLTNAINLIFTVKTNFKSIKKILKKINFTSNTDSDYNYKLNNNNNNNNNDDINSNSNSNSNINKNNLKKNNNNNNKNENISNSNKNNEMVPYINNDIKYQIIINYPIDLNSINNQKNLSKKKYLIETEEEENNNDKLLKNLPEIINNLLNNNIINQFTLTNNNFNQINNFLSYYPAENKKIRYNYFPYFSYFPYPSYFYCFSHLFFFYKN